MQRATEDGGGPLSNEQPGDVCYYAPWGNLAFFHAGYRYSRGLIRLGRLNDDPKPLLMKGSFPCASPFPTNELMRISNARHSAITVPAMSGLNRSMIPQDHQTDRRHH